MLFPDLNYGFTHRFTSTNRDYNLHSLRLWVNPNLMPQTFCQISATFFTFHSLLFESRKVERNWNAINIHWMNALIDRFSESNRDQQSIHNSLLSRSAVHYSSVRQIAWMIRNYCESANRIRNRIQNRIAKLLNIREHCLRILSQFVHSFVINSFWICRPIRNCDSMSGMVWSTRVFRLWSTLNTLAINERYLKIQVFD